MTQELTRRQQLLLQRLLAAHALTHQEAIDLFQGDGHSLEDCWRVINKQLSAGFGLEVATVSLKGTKYHTIINLDHNDIAAKNSFSSLSPHQRAYIRLILENMVQSNDDGVARMDLINIRTQLKDPYKALSLEESEQCLDDLLDEKWIIADESPRNIMNQKYHIGPRVYLELSSLLKDFGEDNLPQFIFHRA